MQLVPARAEGPRERATAVGGGTGSSALRPGRALPPVQARGCGPAHMMTLSAWSMQMNGISEQVPYFDTSSLSILGASQPSGSPAKGRGVWCVACFESRGGRGEEKPALLTCVGLCAPARHRGGDGDGRVRAPQVRLHVHLAEAQGPARRKQAEHDDSISLEGGGFGRSRHAHVSFSPLLSPSLLSLGNAWNMSANVV